ncbi:50S ribosomal protein L25/general stress protein Ctc [Porphyromonas cangingivalis]|uniref:Large ribosomal subunit protein bL25 n=1 Tax=Porphyromonas cangingivalis TaxID=36874 RepID=A0A099WZA8_PORCN|nr:50S ribosomal protein L25/general stress protein Ctc [Porphyromonas cangingivalis]KGL49500.1 50S ribosomal protein L25 [Porphyromonas cangingivalis]KGN82483.1 50S ribosomal protein L25 [Porphyromonas cangingivalis]SJZ56347.1 large subunit ribosomal protein L25 [Porphyromonas cangingivalis]SPY34556.1 General stress protein CTC [Porphyromonas cangingivalis]VEJ02903.1 General stress protein CTC [Porphyromonas cangingivalis]
MKTFQLSAEVRTDLGKKGSKALRKQELIPAILYGFNDNTALTVSQDAVRKLIYTPDIYLIEMTVGGATKTCILQDIQFHPVTDKILHIDFLEVKADKPIIIEVPVVLEGHAVGVRAGGKLSLDMRKLKVKALYSNVPEKLTIDVSKLGLGKTIQVGSLSFENIELLNAKNAVVAAVRLTRAARGAAAKAALEAEDEDAEEGEE